MKCPVFLDVENGRVVRYWTIDQSQVHDVDFWKRKTRRSRYSQLQPNHITIVDSQRIIFQDLSSYRDILEFKGILEENDTENVRENDGENDREN